MANDQQLIESMKLRREYTSRSLATHFHEYKFGLHIKEFSRGIEFASGPFVCQPPYSTAGIIISTPIKDEHLRTIHY